MAKTKVDNNRRAKSLKLQGLNISYRTLPTIEKNSGNVPGVTPGDIISPKVPSEPSGPSLASTPTMRRKDEKICPISNLPDRPEPPEDPFPDEYKMEIYRLRNDNEFLRNAVEQKNNKIRRAILTLTDELRFWRVGLIEGIWETYDGIQARVRKIESTVQQLEDFNAWIEAPANARRHRK